jgi:hypothetical protein
MVHADLLFRIRMESSGKSNGLWQVVFGPIVPRLGQRVGASELRNLD